MSSFVVAAVSRAHKRKKNQRDFHLHLCPQGEEMQSNNEKKNKEKWK